MNPKTLQYLMGHSDIGVTMNVYTYLGLEDAAAEMSRMEKVESPRRKQDRISGGGKNMEKLSGRMFRVIGMKLGLIAEMAVGSFFDWWKISRNCDRVKGQRER